jgi:integrase/recombinase XerD
LVKSFPCSFITILSRCPALSRSRLNYSHATSSGDARIDRKKSWLLPTIGYPILDDIGWAIIDYLKNGRPKTESPYLFVRHNAPFEAFGACANLHNIIARYTRLAGIHLRTGASRGMHSLRHTLAGVLLEQGTPLPVIAEILGHRSTLSTGVYLKIDVEGLVRCALDPDEVFRHD